MDTKTVKEKPIIFSTQMIRAILSGHKTQTRRVVKKMALDWLDDAGFDPEFVALAGNGFSPYGFEGDELWVRETWGVGTRPDPLGGWIDGIEYKADESFYKDEELPIRAIDGFDYERYESAGWRPSIHMPRTASRLQLKIKRLWIERLHDISEEDATQEGVGAGWQMNAGYPDYTQIKNGVCQATFDTARDSFFSLWQSINGQESLEANPWVWCIEFENK